MTLKVVWTTRVDPIGKPLWQITITLKNCYQNEQNKFKIKVVIQPIYRGYMARVSQRTQYDGTKMSAQQRAKRQKEILLNYMNLLHESPRRTKNLRRADVDDQRRTQKATIAPKKVDRARLGQSNPIPRPCPAFGDNGENNHSISGDDNAQSMRNVDIKATKCTSMRNDESIQRQQHVQVTLLHCEI